MPTPLEVCRRFINLVETLNLDVKAYEEVLDPAFVAREFPNALNPRGQSRSFADSMDGMKRATEILGSQNYQVLHAAASGDRVYLEITWNGTLKNGKSLTAHLCQAYELRAGRIVNLRTYDCYEPIG